MLNSLECHGKADELEAYGLTCTTHAQRDDYASAARAWRRSAALALEYEQSVVDDLTA